MANVSVARTMTEQGIICAECEHPWGRHHVDGGCVSRSITGRARHSTCGCLELPEGPAVPPAQDDGPTAAGMPE